MELAIFALAASLLAKKAYRLVTTSVAAGKFGKKSSAAIMRQCKSLFREFSQDFEISWT